jgi:hypothetical protein
MKTVLAVLLVLMCGVQAHAAGHNIVFYRIGDSGQEAWTLLKVYFEGKGYGVTIVQGETVIEKHVEKVNRINRGPGGVFLAMELIPDELSRVMVAESDAKGGEGRFLAIDEIPARFAHESDRLASDVAAPFNVKVKHLPLFPLLGVNMPGIVVKLEFSEGETTDVIAKLFRGVETYFSERIKKDEK